MSSNNYLKLNHPSMVEVKLILGNGFDLACGLKSSCLEFFHYSDAIYGKIGRYIDTNSNEFPKEATIWDLVFLLFNRAGVKAEDPNTIKWSDIEKVMRLALGFKTDKYLPVFFNIHNIYLSFDDKSIELNNYEKIILKAVNDLDLSTKENFYDRLLKQLEKFEDRFTTFIKEQMNDEYEEKAEKMLTSGNFLNIRIDQLYSIDTFNYTTPKVFDKLREINPKFNVRHVNGEIGKAIFGIDSHDILVSDPRYVFTKTYRKMIRLAKGDREDHNRKFSNVVIYGHSLSEPDYSYFFSIMDHLKLDIFGEFQSRLVIAFSKFADDAETQVAWSALKMIDSYDHYKNPLSSRYGLVEILETSDRIGFAFIDSSKL